MILVSKFGGSSLASPEHVGAVADRIASDATDGASRVVVVSAMGDTTDDLIALARRVTRRPDPRELDLLLATGEHISAALLVMALEERGVQACALTGSQAGIRTDGLHGRARITEVDPVRVRRELAENRVVVVAGFQGTAGDEIVTLGRGGSDTSAVALAIAVGARRCEIFTDVDGVYTADPRLVPDARRLSEIGYEEMLELAHQGARVLQVRSVELGWLGDVEIAVRHAAGTGSGTIIRRSEMEARRKVRGIATEDGIAKLTLLDLPDRPGVAAAVLEPLAEAGIAVDGIIQNIGHDGRADLSFIVPEADLERARELVTQHLD
jgi:aspartate kinase